MLKPSFEAIHHSESQSIIVREFGPAAFEAPFHFHPEYELTLIVNGSGERFVGTKMDRYQPGDLVLLGANLPHCWKGGHTVPEGKGCAVVVQFSDEFLGKDFLERPEFLPIRRLLRLSANGIRFSRNENNMAGRLTSLAQESSGFKQIIAFLEILHGLANSGHDILDQDFSNQKNQRNQDSERINRVFTYVVENFRNDISLSEASGLINMTPNAFCRYFKRMTRHTFFDHVIDYRINFATQSLINSDKSVTDVCFESGFRSTPYFNKVFKRKTGVSPLQYKRRYHSELAVR